MMRRRLVISTALVAFAIMAFCVTPGFAELGNGSTINDTLQIGTVTKIGDRVVDIATKFEKKSKNYTLHLLPECYVMTANRGVFMKFKELKKGDLIAAYGWNKGGKWNARRIDVLNTNDYLIKRLAMDAKAGVYYKHER